MKLQNFCGKTTELETPLLNDFLRVKIINIDIHLTRLLLYNIIFFY